MKQNPLNKQRKTKTKKQTEEETLFELQKSI